MVRVNLRGRFGYGRPRVYYGPGVCDVPDGLARALGLQGLAEPPADEGAHETATLADEGATVDTDVKPPQIKAFKLPEGQGLPADDSPPAKPIKRGKR